jgi:hypothetical protein
MDATYNLAGGFKPTLKRFADLNGPDFFPTPGMAAGRIGSGFFTPMRNRSSSFPIAALQSVRHTPPTSSARPP